MRSVFASLFAALLCAGAARAQDPRSEPQQPPAPAQQQARPPLSKEDAELIKQLALLEKLELVKNLDLFEGEKGDTLSDDRPK